VGAAPTPKTTANPEEPSFYLLVEVRIYGPGSILALNNSKLTSQTSPLLIDKWHI